MSKYVIAVSSVAAVFAFRLVGWPWFGADVPFLFFFPAVAFAGWYGGFGPGVLATALSTATVAFWFLTASPSLTAMKAHSFLYLCVFVATSTLISRLMEGLHRARGRAEESERKAEAHAARLAESNRTLEAMMEYIPTGIAIVEAPDGRIRRVSKCWGDLVGRAPRELEGEPLDALLDRRQAIRIDGAGEAGKVGEFPVIRALRDGEVVTGQEWLLRSSDRRVIPVICEAGPIRDGEGKTVQAVISWHDIAERRRMEIDLRAAHADLENRVRQRTEELAKSNEELTLERQRLFMLLEALPFFVCLLDRRHSVSFSNHRFRTLFPQTDGPASYTALTGRTGECSGCPSCRVGGANQPLVWEWKSPAGRTYEVYDLSFASSPLDPLTLEIGVDISARKEAERAVQLEKNKLLGILNLMREGVYIVSQQNKIEFMNPAFEREFGAPLPGLKCFEQLHQRTEHCPWCRLHEVVEGGSFASEWSALNGKVYDVFDGPLLNHDGSVSTLKILHDVTEHKRARQALEKSERELQRLSSELMVAQEAERARISRELHDALGQTLTLVKMRIGLIERGLIEAQPQLKEHCLRASSHLDELIENTRRLSRDLRPALLENAGITAALRRLLADTAKASGIEIRSEIENIDQLSTEQSRILLYRVIQEMLNNIMKHSRATEVKVSARRTDGNVVIEVRDNGVGMNLGDVESRESAERRGMGLAIMRERVRTLGGSLEISSRPGSGTGMRFSFPAEEQGGTQ